MFGRQSNVPRLCQMNVMFFHDSDTGDTYTPEEYKLVQNAIKEGHYVEAHYTDKDNEKHYVTSRVFWIGKKRFRTQYKIYRYVKPI